MTAPSNPDRIPVFTLADLATLDDAEMAEGYRDGREGFPCGENRSRSYWHGWRNGMVDSGRMEKDVALAVLTREYAPGGNPEIGLARVAAIHALHREIGFGAERR